MVSPRLSSLGFWGLPHEEEPIAVKGFWFRGAAFAVSRGSGEGERKTRRRNRKRLDPVGLRFVGVQSLDSSRQLWVRVVISVRVGPII